MKIYVRVLIITWLLVGFVLSAPLHMTLASGEITETDWAQFQKDEVQSGKTTCAAPVNRPAMSWSRYTYNQGAVGIQVPPVIVADRVYIFAGTGLWAFNKADGSLLWEKHIPDHGTMQTSTPAYGNGKILVATFDGYIFAFDAITGQECWNKKVSDTIFQCPITCYDGKFYIGDGGTGGETNNYYCIDSDGNVIWTYPAATAGYLWAGASVIGDYLVFGNRESVLTSLNRHNGEPVDILDLTTIHPDAGKIRASVTYHNGYVYNTSQSMSDEGYIWKTGFDPNTGNFTGSAWNNPIGFSTSTPVVHEGKVYIGEGEHGCPGSLICLNDTSGIIEWQYPVPMGVKSSPALSVQNGTAYIYFTIAQNDGLLYCVKADGTLAWSWDPPDNGYIVQGAAISEGMVFFGNSSGNIYALRECPDWDLNGDGEIDIGDIAVVGLHWNETGSPGWIPEDLSPDGIIDIGDIAVIGMHWSN